MKPFVSYLSSKRSCSAQVIESCKAKEIHGLLAIVEFYGGNRICLESTERSITFLFLRFGSNVYNPARLFTAYTPSLVGLSIVRVISAVPCCLSDSGCPP